MSGSGKTRILAVDDNYEALGALADILAQAGYEVSTAASGKETLQKVKSEDPELILLDVRMPDMSGLDVAKSIKSDPEFRFIPVTLLTSLDSLDDVVAGFEAGADDYIVKPFQKEELLARVRALLRLKKTYQELKRSEMLNKELEARLEGRSGRGSMIGESPGMLSAIRLIEKVSASEAPVLVLGETGTGKELAASAIHYGSRRSGKGLIIQNCAALSESLLESELFGHVRGAFSGAVRDKQGLFELADGGTFFLDELGEMGLSLQAKLLRVLQDGTFFPVGGTKQKKVDVRIIAATHRDLEKMIAEGKFREDLYYRLNVVSVKLPPLRERLEDIPRLAQHFLKSASERHRRGALELSSGAMKALRDYAWPGNIRELQNEMERLVILAGDESTAESEHLSSKISLRPKMMAGMPAAANLKDAVGALERAMIEEALKAAGGNKSEASKKLGISRSNLIAKVKEFGLEAGGDD